MKSLLTKNDAAEIATRAQKLTPQHEHLWGKMNVTEMLRHCNIISQRLLETDGVYQKPTLMQLAIKYIFLYLKPTFPRNRKGPRPANTLGTIGEDQFGSERQQFIDLALRFPEHPKPITVKHPMFGCLSTREWGYAAWKHHDHHLRQFGV